MLRPALQAHFPSALALGVVLLFLPNCASAQHDHLDPFIATTPFATWLGTSPKPQIPWKVETLPFELTFYQRVHLSVLITVPGTEVRRYVSGGGLAFMYQITDAAGRVYQDDNILQPQKLDRGARKGDLMAYEHILLVAGQYRLSVALYDPQTREYSFHEESVTIPELSPDPLNDSWPQDPSVYFFQPDDPGFTLLAHVPMSLNLSVKDDRPVHLNVLVNLNPYPDSAQSPDLYNRQLLSSLAALAILTQLNLPHGSVSASVIDSLHRRIFLEEDDASEINWSNLQSAVQSQDPLKIDVRALQDPAGEETFLATQIEKLLRSVFRAPANGAAPLNVLILVSNSVRLDSQAAPDPPPALTVPPGLVVYYIATELSPDASPKHLAPTSPAPPPSSHARRNDPPWQPAPPPDDNRDQILPLLAPFQPHLFDARYPDDFRAALADLLAEISR
jgi:hypothetical protein